MGPEGVAAPVTLSDQMLHWFQVKDSIPHVTLMVKKGHESQELKPMVKRAMEVREWLPAGNGHLYISKDKQFMRVGTRSGDYGIAERVILEDRLVRQTMCAILQQISDTL